MQNRKKVSNNYKSNESCEELYQPWAENQRKGIAGDNWAFQGNEIQAHRNALAEYATRVQYIPVSNLESSSDRNVGFTEYINEHCDNINLQVDKKGGWCEYCGHYHFKYLRNGEIRKCWWNPYEKQDCMSVGNQEPQFLNCGKYRSEWTIPSDYEEWDYEEPLPKGNLRITWDSKLGKQVVTKVEK